MTVVDPRERTFNALIEVISAPFAHKRMSTIIQLCEILNDEEIIIGLDNRIEKIETFMGADLDVIEGVIDGSDAWDNFIKIGRKRVTEIEIRTWFSEINNWLMKELGRVQNSIRFSRV